MNREALGVRIRRATWLCATIAFALLLLAASAHAAFPGKNGKIAFVRFVTITTVPPYIINDIFVTDSVTQTNLTNATADEAAPAWSADGSRLAFIRDSELWTMFADGTGQRQISVLPGHPKVGPSWSPDGKKIAFAVEATLGGDYCGRQMGGIWTVNSDGTGQPTLVDCKPDEVILGDGPSWSPDGKNVVFVGWSTSGTGADVHVVPVDGNGPDTNLTQNSSFTLEAEPSWSPDGRKIVWASDRGTHGVRHIWTMNADGSDKTRLTNGTDEERDPAWSPDGTKIAFHTFPFPFFPSLFVVNMDDTGRTLFATGTDPDWQPIPEPKRMDYKNANQFCKADRDFLGNEAFAKKYGTSSSGANAFGNCVSRNN